MQKLKHIKENSLQKKQKVKELGQSKHHQKVLVLLEMRTDKFAEVILLEIISILCFPQVIAKRNPQ